MVEVDGIKQSIGQFQEQAQKDLEEKRFNMLKPITEKAKAAIEKVATAQGIEYVFEAGGLIIAKGKNLMADVKAEMGI
jgi:outer membrane protein